MQNENDDLEAVNDIIEETTRRKGKGIKIRERKNRIFPKGTYISVWFIK